MSILKKIEHDLIGAMKRHDLALANILRGAKSVITHCAKNQSSPLTEPQAQSALQSELKKLMESRNQFQLANRPETVAQLDQEISVLKQYLPQPMSEEQLNKIIDEIIVQLKPTGPVDIGRTIGAVMQKVQGRADGALVSRLISQRLSSRLN